MTRSSKCSFWLLALAAFSCSAFGAGSIHRSGSQMGIGLKLVAGDVLETPPPAPAELDDPASPSAVLCRSQTSSYRTCRTPFHGRVVLSRELTDARCIDGHNWGWREGAVWVDQGCAAIFMQEAAMGTPTA